MSKKLILLLTVILTLFVMGPNKQNNVLVAGPNDSIEWNGYEVEELS